MIKKCKMCDNEVKLKRTYCSNICKFKDSVYNKKRSIRSNQNEKHISCICKKTNEKFNDLFNLSGCLTKHIKKLYNETYKSCDFDKYFTKVEHEIKQKLKCPYCNWETTDIKNTSGCFTVHLKNTHNKSLTELYIEHPTYNMISKKEYRLNYLDENDEHSICCKASENIKYTSEGQLELETFLKSIGITNIVRNTKQIIHPFELDIYVPDKNIAIEYNGLYWHNDSVVDKNYHLRKTELCEQKNIQLIHIFEDEWNSKKDIIKSILKSKFHIFDNRIYARKCEIVSITQDEKSKFLNHNHRQGNDKSQIYFGLKYNDELVSVITFCNLRKIMGNTSEEYNYELSRFCSKINIQCIGAFDKLLSHFIKNNKFNSIISYADRRFSSLSNVIYSKKFKFLSNTKPNYFYIQNNKRLHRFNFSKQQLIKKYNADKSKTEFQITDELSIKRIWDCGNLKFELCDYTKKEGTF
jgi:hypothetical protein